MSSWTRVLSLDENWQISAGSTMDLNGAVRRGTDLHVDHLDHYKDSGLLIAATQAVVRIAPVIPVVFHGAAWDFGWLLARSYGYVDRWLCDPPTQSFGKSRTGNRIRWFVSDG